MNRLKYIKIFIFLFIMFFTPRVFAVEYDISSKVKNTTSGNTGTYQGLEVYNTGMSYTYNVNTRYNGRLSMITFFIKSDDWNWQPNTTYTLTLNMATEDWRNKFMNIQVLGAQNDGQVLSNATNQYVSNTFQFVSMKKVKLNFRVNNTISPYLKVVLTSTNYMETAFTGVSNWNLSSIYISTVSSSSATPTPAPVTPTPTPAPSGATNQDIINNQNSNTNNIINNQNSNTNNIINSQNNNTQSIIDNQTSNTTDIIDNNNQNTETLNNSLNSNCKNGPNTYTLSDYVGYVGMYLKSDGTTQPNVSWSLTKFFAIQGSTEYTFKLNSSGNAPSVCFYRSKSFESNSLIGCTSYANRTEFSVITHNSANYMVLSMTGTSRIVITGPICNNWEKEEQDETNQKLDELNSNITSESTPSISLDVDLPSNSPITNLLLMPITLMNTVLNNTSNTCTPYVLPFDFFGGNNTLTLPCINLQNYLGNDVYNILDAILCFYIAYEIGKFCITIYEGLVSLKDNFGEMYSPKHAKGEYQPKHGGGD